MINKLFVMDNHKEGTLDLKGVRYYTTQYNYNMILRLKEL